MHAPLNKRSRTALQEQPRDKFANETEAQRAQHHEIAQEYARKRRKRASPKTYRRIRELEIVFADRYGAVLPDDDAGADDALIMAHHLAHLDNPEQRIRGFLKQRAPWYTRSGTAWLIAKVLRKPLKWTADKLAQRVGLDYATRTRLGITTIGAINCGKTKRASLRTKRNNDKKRLKRVQAGAMPHALSEARLKPWVALGISESTYRRRKRRDSNSGTACPKDIMVKTNHCHPTGARPRLERGAYARAVPALSAVDRVISTETVHPDRIFMLLREKENENRNTIGSVF